MAEARTGFAEEGAKTTYDRLVSDRKPYEDRAEAVAALTVPSVYPKDSDNSSTDYHVPWQGLGARGLKNLVSKLMLALFPPQPFFKLGISEFEAKSLAQDPENLANVERGLAMVERTIMSYIDANNHRVTLYEGEEQGCVAGNYCLYLPPVETGSVYNPIRLYKLNSYVCQRDAFGNILQIITKDLIAFAALPEDVKNSVDNPESRTPEEEIEVYTHIYLDPDSGEYLSYQEVDEKEVEGTQGNYPVNALPWIPVRTVVVTGEDYGRSYLEAYLGDLTSLENLYEAMIKMSMIAAKVLYLVNPNGLTQTRRLVAAQTGAFVAGRKQDIEVLQLDKINDFSITKQIADDIEARLSYSFMLNSAVQRGGERVTAEEIRYVARELEDALGGIYTTKTQELQLPYVNVLLAQLQAANIIPELPQEAIEPTVATGFEALGRGQDLDRLIAFSDMAAAINQIQEPHINKVALLERTGNAIGVDLDGMLFTDEQLQQKQMQEMAIQGAGQGAASAGQAIGGAVVDNPEGAAEAVQAAGIDPSSLA